MPDFVVSNPQPTPTRTVSITFPRYAKISRLTPRGQNTEVQREFFRLDAADRMRVLKLITLERPAQSTIPIGISVERKLVDARTIVSVHERTGFESSNEAEYLAAEVEAIALFPQLRI